MLNRYNSKIITENKYRQLEKQIQGNVLQKIHGSTLFFLEKGYKIKSKLENKFTKGEYILCMVLGI